MSNVARSIWSAAPPAVKCSTASHLVSSFNELTLEQGQAQSLSQYIAGLQQKKQKQQSLQQQPTKGVVPAGHRCSHGKWQPEPAETTEAKKYTCYECAFVCSKCGENSVGLCDSYGCS